jgi:RNA polymerase sigma factor (TIGR02999 family)
VTLRPPKQLLPSVYEQFRILAATKLAQENPGQTPQAATLVHEAFLRLVDTDRVTKWNSRGHFFGATAEAMRPIIVERARRKCRHKHGGGLGRVELTDVPNIKSDEEFLVPDVAVSELAFEDPEGSEVVKLMYFTGFGREEIAKLLGVSVHRVRQKWLYARAWLRLAMEK